MMASCRALARTTSGRIYGILFTSAIASGKRRGTYKWSRSQANLSNWS